MHTDLKLLTDASLRTSLLSIMLRLEAERQLETFNADAFFATAVGLPEVGERRDEVVTIRRRRDDGRLVEFKAPVKVYNVRDVSAREEAEAKAEAERERAIVARMRALYERYSKVSATMPVALTHKAVPSSLRKFAQAAKDAGMLENASVRVIIHLSVLECVYHTYNNGTVPESEAIEPTTLEAVGLPQSKKEERWEHILSTQFIHANGDRRLDREVEVSDDPERESDYNGLPVLPALYAEKADICRTCGTLRRDHLIPTLRKDEQGVDIEGDVAFWQYGITCECAEVTYLYGTEAKEWYSRKALIAHIQRVRTREIQRAVAQRETFDATPKRRALVVPPSALKETRSEEELADLARAERKARDAKEDALLDAKLAAAGR